MCNPESALIKCSIVETDKLLLFEMVVQRLVAETFDQRASIILFPFLSVRINLIPLSSGACSKINSTSIPECNPTPENSIDFLEDALSALKSPGGWIHLYMHVVSEKNDSVLSKATKKLNLLLDNRGIVTNSRIVKQIGPNNYQVVLDIDVDFS